MSRLWLCLHGFDGYSPRPEIWELLVRFLFEWDQEVFQTFSLPGILVTETEVIKNAARPAAG